MQYVHCDSKRDGKEVAEELNDEMSHLRGYERVEFPGINFVQLKVYFDNEKIK